MLSEQEIQNKLQSLGAKVSRLGPMMREVGEIIMGRAILSMTEKLTPDERRHFTTLDVKAGEAYLAAHGIEPLTQARFDAIHDETWQEFFAQLEKAEK
jgi:hypothetical protein